MPVRAIMARLELLVLILVKSASCGFFDLTDVDDPLALLWQSKDTLTKQTSSACGVVVPGTGSVLPGRCRYKTLCLLSGGQINSDSSNSCGRFSTCCTSAVTPKCSQSTKSKISYFTGDSSSLGTDCEFKVHALKNVCQMRLDFEQFQLAASQTEAVDATTLTTTCRYDYMTVTPSIYNIPHFCENNNDQHVYVHLNTQRVVTLTVHLAPRAGEAVNAIANPNWRIRITQLECPAEYNTFYRHDIFDSSANDFPLLAPAGATQYFTEPVGRIRSFGYDGQGLNGNYISDLFYAIAFKRTPYVNCIRFTSNIIHADTNAITAAGVCWDYLFIPELSTTATGPTLADSRVCNRNNPPNNPATFYSRPPGPFYIHFRSQSTYEQPPNPPAAFDIRYELTTCN